MDIVGIRYVCQYKNLDISVLEDKDLEHEVGYRPGVDAPH